MKHFSRAVLTVAILASSLGFAADREVSVLTPGNPDFYMQMIFSEKAQSRIFQELRSLLISTSGFDPLNYRYKQTINVVAPINTEMNAAMKKLVEDVTGMKFGSTEVLVDIEGLRFEAPDASLKIDEFKSVPGGIDASVIVRLRQTVVSADRIYVHFRNPDGSRSFMNKFFVELKNTHVTATNLLSLSVNLGIQARLQRDGNVHVSFAPNVMQTFDKVTVNGLMNELTFVPGNIRVPKEFDLQVGTSAMPMREDGLAEAVQLRKAAVFRLMMDPIVKTIRDLPKTVFSDGIPKISFPSVLKTKVPCIGDVGIRLMRYGRVGKDQLQFGFGIDHPDYHRESGEKSCFDDAADTVYSQIDRNDASVVMGVHHNAISWVLNTFVNGCYLDKIPPSLKLGPQGIEARMDDLGKGTGVIAVHAQTKLKWLIGLIVGRRVLEFPVKVEPELDFAVNGGTKTTSLLLNLSEPDLSDKTMFEGYSKIPSNLDEIRLKKLVMKKVRAQLKDGLSTAKLTVPLPFAQGDDLSYAELKSDGYGFLNLSLSLDPEIRSESAEFWTLFSKSIQPYLKKKDP